MYKDSVKKSAHCLICGSMQLTQFLSLGETALANAYLATADFIKNEMKVPLEVYYCHSCHLCQLLHIVDRDLLFRDYAYFSSTSPQLLVHFDAYAQRVAERFPNKAKGFVVEIASNDGILLKAFRKQGARVLGIDPAYNIAATATENGIETIPEFFNDVVAQKIAEKYGVADIISANNVLAHTDKLHEIIEGVKILLARDGIFVFQSKYLGDLLDKNEFDTVYHEHISYFSLLPTFKLLVMHNLKAFDVEHVETEGGSIRVYATHKTNNHLEESEILKGMIAQEKDIKKLDNPETFLNFSKKPLFVKESLWNILKPLNNQHKKIAGYGASAKGNTLLQYCGIGPGILSYITDNAPSKQGKLTPGTHIPIVSPEELKRRPPDAILLLAWNYASSILEKEKWFLERGGTFIVPIPEPKVVTHNG